MPTPEDFHAFFTSAAGDLSALQTCKIFFSAKMFMLRYG